MSEESTNVSVVLPVHNNLEMTRTCVEALIENTPRGFELILVDNGSDEDLRSLVGQLRAAGHCAVYLKNERNEGFGFASNQGISAALGEWIVLLNNDVVVTAGWLTRMLRLLESADDIALVGARTNRASGPQLLSEASYDGLDGLKEFAAAYSREHLGEHRFLTRIVALCAVARWSALVEVGGFDPCFWLGNFEDDDLCLRLVRRGYRIAVADDVYVHHFGSATWRKSRIDYNRLMQENWDWFCHKWDYTGEMTTPYPALRMARAKTFDPERDHVPFRYEEALHPEMEPMRLEQAKEQRLLLFADPREDGWLRVVQSFSREFSGQDPVTLVVRLEPPSAAVVRPIIERLERSVGELDVAGETLPDILVEQTAIPPRLRGSLYTGATMLLLAGSFRDGLYRREAEACGIPVVGNPDGATLRRMTACAVS
ncbi:MAG: glycosyltransferase family 2 protein [Planctomycetota bacterium]